ncbi:MAG: nicotinate-nucleotide adenylyltransferase [Vicinamibacterales bacterium]
MIDRPRVGLIGGTFDPIHIGHLAAAAEAMRALSLSAVRFLPSRLPPHRTEAPAASAYHRFAMVALALAERASWAVSDAELLRDGPSFTYDTLLAAHAEGWLPSQIFFIAGADAFAEIDTWSRYPAVLDAAHFVVVARPGTAVGSLAARLPSLAARMMRPHDAAALSSPHVILVEAETPAVSSTEIRRRAAAGLPIRDMVPEGVAAHIERHHLYAAGRTPSA